VGAAPTWATRDRPTGVGHPPLDAGEGLVSPEEIRDEVGLDALEAPPLLRWPQDDGRTGAGRAGPSNRLVSGTARSRSPGPRRRGFVSVRSLLPMISSSAGRSLSVSLVGSYTPLTCTWNLLSGRPR
jgi:hypothetical protein